MTLSPSGLVLTIAIVGAAGCHSSAFVPETKLQVNGTPRVISVSSDMRYIASATHKEVIVAERRHDVTIPIYSAQAEGDNTFFSPSLVWTSKSTILTGIGPYLRVTDVLTGQHLRTLPLYVYMSDAAPLGANLLITAGSETLDFGQGGRAKLFAVNAGIPTMVEGIQLDGHDEEGFARSVAASQLGSGLLRVAIAYNSRHVEVVDFGVDRGTLSIFARREVPGDFAIRVAIGNSGRRLALLSDASCRVCDISSDQISVIRQFPVPTDQYQALPGGFEGVHALDISPDGSKVAYCTGIALFLQVIEARTQYTLDMPTCCVQFSPNGEHLVAGHPGCCVIYRIP